MAGLIRFELTYQMGTYCTGDIEATADEAVKMILDTIKQVDRWHFCGNSGSCCVTIVAVYVPIAIGGPGLAPGVRFRKDVPNGWASQCRCNCNESPWIRSLQATTSHNSYRSC
ncbi:hypothetical protein QQ045_018015 [Rhodiola kirilowii]